MGLEPTTFCLEGRSSTSELHPQQKGGAEAPPVLSLPSVRAGYDLTDKSIIHHTAALGQSHDAQHSDQIQPDAQGS